MGYYFGIAFIMFAIFSTFFAWLGAGFTTLIGVAFVSVLPIILLNFATDWFSIIATWMLSFLSSTISEQRLEATGLLAWLFIQFRVVESVGVLVSALLVRLVIRVVRR